MTCTREMNRYLERTISYYSLIRYLCSCRSGMIMISCPPESKADQRQNWSSNLSWFTGMHFFLTFPDLSHFFHWASEEGHRLLESRFLGSNTYVCPLKSVWSRETYLTTLNLSFPICKTESQPFLSGRNILMGIFRYQSPISHCMHLVLESEAATGESFWRLTRNLFSTVQIYTAQAQNHEVDHWED